MKQREKKHTFLLVVTTLMYMIFGFLTSVIGVVIDRFQAEYNVSLAVAALLPFAFFLAYGLTSIPFGLLMDRHGAKPVLLLGTALMSIGSFLCYFSSNYMAVIISVFLIGIGVTAVQIAGNPFIRVLDAPSRYTANLTMVIGIGALGYALSPLVVPVLQANGFSWKAIYLLIALVNIAILGIVACSRFPEAKSTQDEKLDLSRVWALFRHPIVCTYALGIFLYVGAEVGVSSYIITFMNSVHHLTNTQSFWAEDSFFYQLFPSKTALIVALFWLLQAVGRMVASFLMHWMSEKKIFIFHSACTIVALLCAMMGSESVSLVAFALVGYFTCVSFTSIFSAVINSFDRDHGMLSGLLGTAIVGGAFVGWLCRKQMGYVRRHVYQCAGLPLCVLSFGMGKGPIRYQRSLKSSANEKANYHRCRPWRHKNHDGCHQSRRQSAGHARESGHRRHTVQGGYFG